MNSPARLKKGDTVCLLESILPRYETSSHTGFLAVFGFYPSERKYHLVQDEASPFRYKDTAYDAECQVVPKGTDGQITGFVHPSGRIVVNSEMSEGIPLDSKATPYVNFCFTDKDGAHSLTMTVKSALLEIAPPKLETSASLRPQPNEQLKL